jgi:hypothetical protein
MWEIILARWFGVFLKPFVVQSLPSCQSFVWIEREQLAEKVIALL